MEVKFRCSTKFIDSYKPSFQSKGAAGIDLKADIPEAIDLPSFQSVTIPTGMIFEIPDGFEGQVRSRSGLASRDGIFMLNAPGTIDSDYRGVVGVVAANFGQKSFRIAPGDRIAQFVISPTPKVEYMQADQLSDTSRGGDGFGSTGI